MDGTAQLKQALHASQFFTLSFGLIIGIAWIVMLGQWLSAAGPVGAILGFIGGGIVMMLIALCYAEVGTMLPVDGGELAYAYEIFGIKSAYLVGWFLALAYVGIAAFEAISAGWLLGIIVPALRGPVLYTIGGEAVRLGPVVVGVVGMVCITTLNYIGIEFAAALQDIFTYGKIVLAVVFFSAAIIVGKAAHLRPLFQETATGAIAWSGVFAVMATAPFWYGGFNAIPQVIEEKTGRTMLNTVGRVMLLSLTVGIVFYCVVIAAASMAAPWRDLASQEMATVAAFRIAFRSPVWANLVLIAGFCGIITAWNAVFIAASRVLFSLGRARIIGSVFGTVHPGFRSPSVAVLFVGAVGVVSVFLGRTADLADCEPGVKLLCFRLSGYVFWNASPAPNAPGRSATLSRPRWSSHCRRRLDGIFVHAGDVSLPTVCGRESIAASGVEAIGRVGSVGSGVLVHGPSSAKANYRS